ncbi:hypothetical protein CKO_01300 [Citrobacter koseri ATCC BAA-895]|uniref:Uncharacterized protein n=1 Tax=Citrobacter koseri (strain ATCC BAA-895 / CDC 4225-83 / SGSC4696) TaxID=290338 RepID=A8AG27_CITK8|nr:hypothetical protein CKO_01300 [Citrobacter koseri ATCC BAA-895]
MIIHCAALDRAFFCLFLVTTYLFINKQRRFVRTAFIYALQGAYPLIPTYKEFNIYIMDEFENIHINQYVE